jgi:hypothetical protein
MIGTGNRSSIALCLILGSGAPRTNGGSGRKRKPGRTKTATGSRKRTIGLVLSGITIAATTIHGGAWHGCFIGSSSASGMGRTRDAYPVAISLVLAFRASSATGGRGRKRKPSRTIVATGSCKCTIGLVRSIFTITTHTIDGGTWRGCFMGTGNACSMAGTRNGGPVVFSLVRRSSTGSATGGGSRKSKSSRTKIATGSRKCTIGLVLSGGTIYASTTDQLFTGTARRDTEGSTIGLAHCVVSPSNWACGARRSSIARAYGTGIVGISPLLAILANDFVVISILSSWACFGANAGG